MKPAHYRGSYQTRRRPIIAAAYADPTTRCWHCGLTLTEHRPTKAGNPPTWSADHIERGNPNSPLAPSVLSCNARDGALSQQTPWRVTTKRW